MHRLLLWIAVLLSPGVAFSASPTQHQFLAQSAAAPVCGTNCFRVAQTTARTTTGTQDLTFAGFGTPDGYLVALSYGTVLGTVATHAGWSFGAGDTTDEWTVGSSDEDGLAAASDTYRTADNTSSIALPDLAGTLDGQAAFSATVTDGIRLNWPANPAAAAYYLNAVLVKAADVDTGIGTHVGAINTAQSFTVGFQPDVVIFTGTADAFDETVNNNHAKVNIGVAVRGGGQWAFAYTTRNAIATSQSSLHLRNDRAYANTTTSGVINQACEFTGVTATTFELTKRDDAADCIFAYAAFRLDGGVTAWAGIHSMPIVTGEQVVTTPAFRPQILIGISSYNDTVNAARTSNAGGAGSAGLFFADATNLYALHIASEDAVATTDTQSMATSGEILVSDSAGTQVFDVDTLSFTASGWNWTLNTSAPASARLWPMLAISE